MTKLLAFILFISHALSFATAKSKCEDLANESSDPIGVLALCVLNQDTLNPGAEIESNGCAGEGSIHFGEGESCEIGKFEIPHCGIQGKYLCFDGEPILDEGRSANIKMMDFMCIDQKANFMPPPGVTLTFGPCENESHEIHHPGKLKCHCTNSAWVCKVE